MNANIRRLFLVFATLFAAVVATVSYWLWRAPELEARRGNPTLVVRQLTVERGRVYAADGHTLLAANVRRRVQGHSWYLRRYPARELTSHLVGYSTIQRSRTGLERALNDYLTGSNANLHTVLDRTLGRLRGLTQQGNDVVTTIDARAQRVAVAALGQACGAVVAVEPATGRVLVSASSPAYDPNLVEGRFSSITAAEGPCEPAATLLNRATQGLFIPGSTFKVVTAAAALDSGRIGLTDSFVDRGYCIEYGKKVFNFADQSGPEQFGRVTIVEALEHSINAVFCEIGKRIGPKLILEYAERFGFYQRPPLELPAGERAASGLYRGGELYRPKLESDVDPGRLAFGQERLLVTPLQMALVTAAIANRGVLMKPTVVDRVIARDGTLIERGTPQEWRTAVRPETASVLTAMMRRVVESGTGSAAAIPGVSVAGKTGTAETGRDDQNDAWFIAFAPADAPRVAVAVVLQDQQGTGGATAAPIARAIIEAVLAGNP